MPPRAPEEVRAPIAQAFRGCGSGEDRQVRSGRPEPGRTPRARRPAGPAREAADEDAEAGKRGSTASQYDNVPKAGPGGAGASTGAEPPEALRARRQPVQGPAQVRLQSPAYELRPAPVPARRGRSRGRAPPFVQ